MVGFNMVLELGFDDKIDIMIPIRTSLVAGILAGIIGGSGVVFLWERWLRSRPYGWTIRNILISYTVIFGLVAIPSNMVYQSGVFGGSPWSEEILSLAIDRFISLQAFIPFVVWLLVVAFTIIT